MKYFGLKIIIPFLYFVRVCTSIYMFLVHANGRIGPLRHLGLGSNFFKRTSSFCTNLHLSHVTTENFHFLHEGITFSFVHFLDIISMGEWYYNSATPTIPINACGTNSRNTHYFAKSQNYVVRVEISNE
jgi:hypothetical protein